MSRGRLTYLWAAEAVLRKHGRPLRAREIVSYAQEQGLFSGDMYSKTPQKSLQARLSIDILHKGESSRFVRTGPGLFFLRDLLPVDPEAKESAILVASDVTTPFPYTAPRRLPTPPKEHVLAIPQSHYERFLDFQGLRLDDGALLRSLLEGPLVYIPRTEAEDIDDHKQVITYVLVTHGAKVLSFRRGTFSRAAAFLRGSRCIGFGGHVSESDRTIFSFRDSGVRANAARELREEVLVKGTHGELRPEELRVIGVINDDSTEVGRRHVGVVMRHDVGDAEWDAWKNATRGEASINELLSDVIAYGTDWSA